MATLTASRARINLYRLIDEASSTHEPLVITGKRTNAVLVSEGGLECHAGDGVSPFRPWDAGVDPEGTEDLHQVLFEGAGLVKLQVLFTKDAQKDARKLAPAGLRAKTEELPSLLQENPSQGPPPFEKLAGDLDGAYSRRINIHHRFVYQVLRKEKAVKVIRVWTHYE